MTERLQKVMAAAGVASRRKCEEMIAAGQVRVNGVVVREMGLKVDPDKDSITVNGRPLKEKEEFVYILMNKPREIVTTVKDQFGRKTVMDLLGDDVKARVFPVGRLDYDTEGLLLMTNDGDLAARLTHPSFEVRKSYECYVLGHPDEKALQTLQNGVKLDDGMTAPAQVKVLKENGKNTLMSITIHEGRNRQVKRMLNAVGHPVQFLKRTRFGTLTLSGVKAGEYRLLTPAEVKALYDITKKKAVKA